MSTAPYRASVVLVRAPLGGGKSRVVDEITSSLAASGRAVRRILATTATASVPFGAVAHLLPVGARKRSDALTLIAGLREVRKSWLSAMTASSQIIEPVTVCPATARLRSRRCGRARANERIQGVLQGCRAERHHAPADAPTSRPDRRRTIDCSIEMPRPSLIANLRFPGELLACDVMSGTVRT